MLKLHKDQDILDDVEFIRVNYTEYFDSLAIRNRDTDRVVFDLIPTNETKRYGPLAVWFLLLES
jgi:hypothetical protein